MYRVDLNSDLGESFGSYKMGNDDEIIKRVTSVNVACGFHAGDPLVMANTVKTAKLYGTSVGAHPGYPDLMGFGRRNMAVSPEEIKTYVTYQIGALMAFLKAEGMKLSHVKPHGAMYNMAAADYKLALKIAESIASIDENIVFMALSGSEMVRAAKEVGLKVACEVFADRGYTEDGKLVPRNQDGAFIHNAEEASKRLITMIKERKVLTNTGKEIEIVADTVCVHGDNDKALQFVSEIRKALTSEGIELKAF